MVYLGDIWPAKVAAWLYISNVILHSYLPFLTNVDYIGVFKIHSNAAPRKDSGRFSSFRAGSGPTSDNYSFSGCGGSTSSFRRSFSIILQTTNNTVNTLCPPANQLRLNKNVSVPVVGRVDGGEGSV